MTATYKRSPPSHGEEISNYESGRQFLLLEPNIARTKIKIYEENMIWPTAIVLLTAAAPLLACDNCYGPHDDAAHVRNVRRMQPGALNATVQPRAPLQWGQLNFLHTTDTHGWLEGYVCPGIYSGFFTTNAEGIAGISRSRTTVQTGETMSVSQGRNFAILEDVQFCVSH